MSGVPFEKFGEPTAPPLGDALVVVRVLALFGVGEEEEGTHAAI